MGDLVVLRTTAPLVTRVLIEELTVAHTYHHSLPSEDAPRPTSIGHGIGLGFALFVMQYLGSVVQYVSYQQAQIMGCRLRAAVSALDYMQKS